MKAQQLQQQLKFNANTLTKMYKRYKALREERKKWNAYGDDFTEEKNVNAAAQHYAQAALFTPEINKLRKRIAALEDIQVTLKHELKCASCLEAWERADDQEWLQRAVMAQEEGFLWSGTGEEFLQRFGQVDD